MGRVLGVDLGGTAIGLALSDPLGITAGPLTVIVRSRSPEVDHATLIGIAREMEAERIVVGLPVSLSGRHGPAAQAATAEIEALQVAAGNDLPVEAYDERFTTSTAKRVLAEAKVGKRGRKALEDKIAAAVMLQSWLDSRGATPKTNTAVNEDG